MNLETMKSQFSGDYRTAFDGAYKYGLTQSFPVAYFDEKMAELYDLLLTAQTNGKPAEKIVGTDIEAFCKDYFSDFEPENRLVGSLKSLFGVAVVFVLFGLVEWLCAEETLPFGEFRLNGSPILCGLGSGAVLVVLFRLVQPLVMKTKKISAGAWAVIYCSMLVAAVTAATILMQGKSISLPGAPFLIGSTVYAVLYLLVNAVIRYRKTGSFLVKKQENPYKDSYYKNLEDKDVRRIIEKGWLKRYRKLSKRGKTTEATFFDEISRLETFNTIIKWMYAALFIGIAVFASICTLQESDLRSALCFFAVISALEFLVWLLFHKIDQQNAAQRAHILADCEAAGLSLPAFLAQELEETL